MSVLICKSLAQISLAWAVLTGAATAQPRVITMTPHATELVDAAGAIGMVVATVQASNHPAATRHIARIGDGINTSLEQVLAWKPDLVVGWPSALMQRLGELGLTTYVSNPVSLEDIARDIEILGDLLGSSQIAQQNAQQLRQVAQDLGSSTRPGGKKRLRVLVMASPDDQFVIGRHGLINETINRCGGVNPFGQDQALAPRVSLESIISSNPDLIVTGYPASAMLSRIAPVLEIEADLLYRPGPRFLQAARQICAALNADGDGSNLKQTTSKDRAK